MDKCNDEPRFPEWSDCFNVGLDDEDAWEEIEMDNALMERGL